MADENVKTCMSLIQYIRKYVLHAVRTHVVGKFPSTLSDLHGQIMRKKPQLVTHIPKTWIYLYTSYQVKIGQTVLHLLKDT